MHSQESYHLVLQELPNEEERQNLAERMFPRVFRTHFQEPGFGLVSLEWAISSRDLRRFLIDLKQDLSRCYQQATGRFLAYRSLSRFDQQATTRFHLDGAPDESYLMLGYEPSEVACDVWAADYALAAYERGIAPTAYLTQYNPMHAQSEEQLFPYATQLKAFDPCYAQVLLLNNSCLPYSENGGGFQGVMHKATILTPQPDKSRIINSTLLISVENASAAPVSIEEQQEFVRRD